MLLYKLAILCMIIIAGIAAGGCVLGSIRLTYGYLFQHWKCPDLGALGGRLWYDDHRGECYCGVFFATCFSAIALVFAFLASGEDPAISRSVRLRAARHHGPVDLSHHRAEGLCGRRRRDRRGRHGRGRVAGRQQGCVSLREIFWRRRRRGFATTTGRACARRRASRPTARSTPFCLSSSRRPSSSIDGSTPKKTRGTGSSRASASSAWRRFSCLNMLVYFSFDCLMQLPTGAFFVPASDDTEAAYARRRRPGDVVRGGCGVPSARVLHLHDRVGAVLALRRVRPLADADVELGDGGPAAARRFFNLLGLTPGAGPRPRVLRSVDGGCFVFPDPGSSDFRSWSALGGVRVKRASSRRRRGVSITFSCRWSVERDSTAQHRRATPRRRDATRLL